MFYQFTALNWSIESVPIVFHFNACLDIFRLSEMRFQKFIVTYINYVIYILLILFINKHIVYRFSNYFKAFWQTSDRKKFLCDQTKYRKIDKWSAQACEVTQRPPQAQIYMDQ